MTVTASEYYISDLNTQVTAVLAKYGDKANSPQCAKELTNIISKQHVASVDTLAAIINA